MKKILSFLNKIIAEVLDVRFFIRGIFGYFIFWKDFISYQKLSGKRIEIKQIYPRLHDRTATTEVDRHYYYANGWAARRILYSPINYHVDIGSQVILANLLGAVTKVFFLDYRPVRAPISGFFSISGSLLQLPFSSNSIPSLSCIHVVEHIGLGRYGDPLDPHGTEKALEELTRVLAPDGDLFLALPVGYPHLCFNAHRVLSPVEVVGLVTNLELIEFSAVDDLGVFHEKISPESMIRENYACGLYWFKKRALEKQAGK